MLLQQHTKSPVLVGHTKVSLFNIYSQLFGYYSKKKVYAKEVPLFHLTGIIHLIIRMLDMVELWQNYGWNFM